MLFRTILSLSTLVFAVATVAIIGLDRWIIMVWLLVAGVLTILAVLGRLLAKEMDLGPGRPTSRLPWLAGALAAFVSCTMAAAIVRVDAPLRLFWLLGVLMAMGVACLRLAYHPLPAAASP